MAGSPKLTASPLGRAAAALAVVAIAVAGCSSSSHRPPVQPLPGARSVSVGNDVAMSVFGIGQVGVVAAESDNCLLEYWETYDRAPIERVLLQFGQPTTVQEDTVELVGTQTGGHPGCTLDVVDGSKLPESVPVTIANGETLLSVWKVSNLTPGPFSCTFELTDSATHGPPLHESLATGHVVTIDGIELELRAVSPAARTCIADVAGHLIRS